MRASALGLTIVLSIGIACPMFGSQPAMRRDATGAAGHPPRGTAGLANSGTSPPRFFFARQTTFAIPFTLDQTDRNAQEVLLFFSADHGRTWSLYGRRPPAEGRFVFRAAGDGEYWFASRTVAPGAPAPVAASFNPELSVVVDTVRPRVDLQATVNADGNIRIAWDAYDQNLMPDGFKLEYQSGLTNPWQPIPIQTPNDAASRTTIRGETDWQPDKSDRIVSIRVQVTDRAENTSEMTRRLIIPLTLATRTPKQDTMAATSVPRDPYARYGLTPNETEERGTQSEEHATWSPQQYRNTTAGKVDSRPGAGHARWQDGGHGGRWQAESPDARPGGSSNTGRDGSDSTRRDEDDDTGQGENSEAWRDENGGTWQNDNGDTRWNGDDGNQEPASRTRAKRVAWPNDKQQEDNPSWQGDYSPSQSPVGPRVANRGSARRSGAADASFADDMFGHEPSSRKKTGGSSELPGGERRHMTNSKRFNLDYSIDAVGPQGVEKVELWVTRNGGRDWDLWGLDEDRETPFLVSVKEEGIYGFRVVIVGRNGLASQTPRSGDPADLWVGVDNTKPVAEITSAAYGSGAFAGHLDIRWTASDEHLGAEPITLSFSENRNGPWTPIAAGLPNNGQYYWRVDSRVPDKFYLRLEVRDEAGNTSTYDLEEPIKSAGLTPKAHVRAVRPFGR